MDIVSGPQGQVNGSSDPIEQLNKLLNIQILKVKTYGDLKSGLTYLVEVVLGSDRKHIYLGEITDFASQQDFQTIVAKQTGRWPARVSRSDWDLALVAITAAAGPL